MGELGAIPNRKWCSRATLGNIVIWCWCVSGWYVIAASHFHYTVDVIVGILMTYLVFYSYHFRIKLIWLGRPHPLFSCFRTFLRWYEKPSKDLKFWRAKAAKNLQDALNELSHSDSSD